MKQPQNQTRNQNEKVLALYRAVIALIEEEADINGMKVVDITNRAGIGKGTAYEYFASKEEMIVQALLYDAQQQLGQILEVVSQENTLREKVFGVFQWLIVSFGRRSSIQFFKLSTNSYEVGNSLHKEFIKMKEDCTTIQDILDRLVQQGRKEGYIRAGMPNTFVYMIFAANFMSFFMYLEKEEQISDVGREETKEFLYGNMITCLKYWGQGE